MSNSRSPCDSLPCIGWRHCPEQGGHRVFTSFACKEETERFWTHVGVSKQNDLPSDLWPDLWMLVHPAVLECYKLGTSSYIFSLWGRAVSVCHACVNGGRQQPCALDVKTKVHHNQWLTDFLHFYLCHSSMHVFTHIGTDLINVINILPGFLLTAFIYIYLHLSCAGRHSCHGDGC